MPYMSGRPPASSMNYPRVQLDCLFMPLSRREPFGYIAYGVHKADQDDLARDHIDRLPRLCQLCLALLALEAPQLVLSAVDGGEHILNRVQTLRNRIVQLLVDSHTLI